MALLSLTEKPIEKLLENSCTIYDTQIKPLKGTLMQIWKSPYMFVFIQK